MAGDYYLTLETSLGASLTLNSGDDADDEGKTLDINATHFFLPQVAVSFGLSKFIADDSQEDADLIYIEAVARF